MAGELILIIEDNEKNRKLVRDVFQVKGYNRRVADIAAGLREGPLCLLAMFNL
jgi:CheY-like chemotaxis protein